MQFKFDQFVNGVLPNYVSAGYNLIIATWLNGD